MENVQRKIQFHLHPACPGASRVEAKLAICHADGWSASQLRYLRYALVACHCLRCPTCGTTQPDCVMIATRG